MKMKDAIATSWLRLMAARHGILPTIDKVTVDEPASAPQAKEPGLLSKLAPIALAALLGGGAAAGAAWMLGDTQEEAPVIQREGSLLQYLEDRGDHQPL